MDHEPDMQDYQAMQRGKWRNVVGSVKASITLIGMLGFPFLSAFQPGGSPLSLVLTVLAFMLTMALVLIGLRTNLLMRVLLAMFYLLSNGFLALWLDSPLYLGFFMAWGVIWLWCLEPVMRKYIG
jgi:hypothetical protein